MKPSYNDKYLEILYPEYTELDIFLNEKGIHKDPSKLVKIVDGKVIPNIPKKLKPTDHNKRSNTNSRMESSMVSRMSQSTQKDIARGDSKTKMFLTQNEKQRDLRIKKKIEAEKN